MLYTTISKLIGLSREVFFPKDWLQKLRCQVPAMALIQRWPAQSWTSRGSWRAGSCMMRWSSTYFPRYRRLRTTYRSRRQSHKFCFVWRKTCGLHATSSSGATASSSSCSSWTGAPRRFCSCSCRQLVGSRCSRWPGRCRPRAGSSYVHSASTTGSFQLRTFRWCRWFLARYYRRSHRRHRWRSRRQSRHSNNVFCLSWVLPGSTYPRVCCIFRRSWGATCLRTHRAQKRDPCKSWWHVHFCSPTSRPSLLSHY